MEFIADLTWWLLLVACVALALLPSFIRPFRLVPLVATVLGWASILAIMCFRFNTAAVVAGLLLSLAGGLLGFLLAVFFSGLDLMTKKRFR